MNEDYKSLKKGDQIIYTGNGSKGSDHKSIPFGVILTLREDADLWSGCPDVTYVKNGITYYRDFSVSGREWRKLNPFDGKLTDKHWVHKEDMPDEETHNRVRQAFIDIDTVGSGMENGLYSERGDWSMLVYCNGVCWGSIKSREAEHRLHPQQIFDYLDKQQEEEEVKHSIDDVVSVEMTKGELLYLKALAGNVVGSGLSNVYSKLEGLLCDCGIEDGLSFSDYNTRVFDYRSRQYDFEKDVESLLNPEPTEQELRAEVIKELEDKINELKALDNN